MKDTTVDIKLSDTLSDRYLNIEGRIPAELLNKTVNEIFDWINNNKEDKKEGFIQDKWYGDEGFIPAINAGIFNSMYCQAEDKEEYEIIAHDIYDYINDIESRKEFLLEGEWHIENADEFLDEIEKNFPDDELINYIYELRDSKTEYDYGKTLFLLLFGLELFDDEEEEDDFDDFED